MRYPYLVNASPVDIPDFEQLAPEDAGTLPVELPACWLVDMEQWQEGWKIVCALRNSKVPKVYLRPLIYINAPESIPTEIELAADGMFKGEIGDKAQWTQILSRVEPINQWIEDLPDAETTGDVNIPFKVLRLFASRHREQAPITSTRRNSGFVYPLIEPLFPVRDTGALDTLDFLYEQRLLSGRFFDRAFFCHRCDSAFLNFKETCPHCEADDITSNELIHHFKCAHVAEINEFRRDDSLICPKCDRQLRHIGVDYDKPSVIHRCNQCAHQFQDPVTIAGCYNCGHSSASENQIRRDIRAYGVSAIGINAASYGMDAIFVRFLKSEIQLHNFEVFTAILQIEKARVIRYSNPVSSLVIIQLRDVNELYTKFGRRAQEVFAELSSAFKAMLRESDVITARNESLFLVLMTQTNEDNAEQAVKRLEQSVKSLLKNNVQFECSFATKVLTIGKETNLDPLLESFLKENAD